MTKPAEARPINPLRGPTASKLSFILPWLQAKIYILLSLCLMQASPSAMALTLQHIEPPNWWAGMQHQQVEVMLHGHNIAQWEPSLSHRDVQLLGSQRSDNPNYLWLQLHIKPTTQPGWLEFHLRHGQEKFILQYELQARINGSAEREGFSSADVVLNLMPDRFAKGAPSKDKLPGFDEPIHRESMTGRHGGNIAGIVTHLNHIAGMGYTAIWPTPLVENRQAKHSYHGYAATDLYRIDPRFGSNEDYRHMVQAARQKGLKVIKDIVPNHIGDYHWWMRDLPAKDWLSNHNQYIQTNHARTTVSDPYASSTDREGFISGWFTRAMPDLNSRNARVANYLIQNAIWWAEYAGIAGFRVDTYGYSDASFINEWVRRIRQEYPQLGIVGEEWTDNPAVQSYWARGRTQANGYQSHLPSVMDFVLHGQLLKALTEPESWNTGFRRLYESLANDQLVAHPQDLMLFDGNHDTPRLFSVLNEDPALTRMALAYVLTMKRTPQLYYGTEVLMTSPKKHDNFDAFRADFPGGWPGDTVNAFTGEGLTTQQKEHQQWLRQLLNWRKTQSVIHHGHLMHFVPDNGTYVLVRYQHNTRVVVAFNKNTHEATLDTARFREILPVQAQAKDVITGQTLTWGPSVTLPARSVRIFQMDTPP